MDVMLKYYFPDKTDAVLLDRFFKNPLSLPPNNLIYLNGKDGMTSLLWAVIKHNLQAGEQLLLAGADIDKLTVHGESALCLAVLSGQESFVKTLIAYHASINLKGYMHYTPLLLAIETQQINMLRLLASAGANVNLPSDEGSTPLMYAIDLENAHIIKTLIEYGANLDAAHPMGFTARSLLERSQIIID